MSQSKELQAVKDRIRKLSQMTIERGASETEANQAMERVGALLEQYNLTMDEIDIRGTQCVTVSFNTGKKNRVSWETVFVGLGKFADCRVWKNANNGYDFFGFPEDTEMVLYLCRVIQQAVETETEAYKRSEEYAQLKQYQHGRALVTSFQRGMGRRIYNRLIELKREIEEDRRRSEEAMQEEMQGRMVEASEEAQVESARATTGTALIAVKWQTVEEQFREQGLRLRKSYGKARVSNSSSFHAGQRAGNKVNLSRPVGGGSEIAGFLR